MEAGQGGARRDGSGDRPAFAARSADLRFHRGDDPNPHPPDQSPHPKNSSATILGTRLVAGDTVTRDTHYPAADGAWRPVVSAMAGMRLHQDEQFFVRPASTVAIEVPTELELAAIAIAADHDGLEAPARAGLETLLEKLRRVVR